MEAPIELIRKLPKYIALGHGAYNKNPSAFIVPPNTVYIFISKASRYLVQSVITPEFYTYFGRANRNYTAKNSRNMPDVVKGWDTHVYGPGQQISDITLQFSDPNWPGMGVHHLPIQQDQFKTTPGMFSGQTGTLSSLNLNGVIFIIACRAIEGQSKRYHGQNVSYIFDPSSVHARLVKQDSVSSALRKRKATPLSSTVMKKTRRVSPSLKNVTNKMSKLRLN
jgi:hypothetical protein